MFLTISQVMAAPGPRTTRSQGCWSQSSEKQTANGKESREARRRPWCTFDPWEGEREGGKLGRGDLGCSAVLKLSKAGEKSSRARELSEGPALQHGPRILPTQSSAGPWVSMVSVQAK